MSKVFICGSRSVYKLQGDAQELISKLNASGNSFIVGDCYGADYEVQKYLSKIDATYTVYYSGAFPRHQWDYAMETVRVPVPDNISRGREYHAIKDKQMCADADILVALWDGTSKGTLANITAFKDSGKTAYVFNTRI